MPTVRARRAGCVSKRRRLGADRPGPASTLISAPRCCFAHPAVPGERLSGHPCSVSKLQAQHPPERKLLLRRSALHTCLQLRPWLDHTPAHAYAAPLFGRLHPHLSLSSLSCCRRRTALALHRNNIRLGLHLDTPPYLCPPPAILSPPSSCRSRHVSAAFFTRRHCLHRDKLAHRTSSRPSRLRPDYRQPSDSRSDRCAPP